MIDDLQVGQVLWLKVRYQIDKIAQVKHPMLVADIQDDYIEIIALDKIYIILIIGILILLIRLKK